MNANVSVVVKYRSIIDNVRLASVWSEIEPLEADLRNIDSLRQFRKRKYDCVFHLAAYNHVGDSFLQVNEALMSNTVATANLLENGPRFGRFIYTSSSEVYGLQESVPFRETNIPCPVSPYAVGKYAGEVYARMKRIETGSPIICIRPFNVFGPYQSDRAIIPELIIKCLKGVPIETTRGAQTREFNYVDNIIDAFMIAATMKKAPEKVINVGAQEEISVADLARSVHAMTGSVSELKIGALPYRPTEIWRMRSDSQRAKKTLGWKPAVPFKEGLRRTIEWYRKYLSAFYGPDSDLHGL
jgi:nucleoside-diphosphate-sugar epimerase